MSKNRRPPDHGDRESRRRRALERLGTDDPSCLICHKTNPIYLELDHVAGRAYDDETTILCSNHHDDKSDRQKEHPEKIEGCTSVLEPVAHWLFNLGDLLLIAAEEPYGAELKELLSYVGRKLHELAHILIGLARNATPSVNGGAK